ncbi:thioredoxin fold domain-containing protein [candidate division KSB1 bacterium]|nr:thioredoxin fold domain-containing protein [candidate division KSB1 bacterium]
MNRKTSLLLLFIFIISTGVFSQFGAKKVLDVEVKSSQNAVVPGEPFMIAVILNIEPGLHINSHTPGSDFFIPTIVTFDSLKDVEFSVPVYPKALLKAFPFSEEKISVYDKQVVIVSRVTTKPEYAAGTIKISGKVSYQGCDDNVCFPPGDEFFEINLDVVPSGTQVEKINQQYFSSVTDKVPDAEQEQLLTEDEIRAQEIFERGILYTIFAFFLVGLALNLTPCVYPVIPLTVSYFGGQSGRSRGSSFISALFYQLGIAVAFAILGLLSGLAGKQWGFLFQSPWFIIVIATIILAMAASLFGAFEITVPNWLLSGVGKSREGVIGALIMGLTVGVVIAPCAAGIIIGLVGLVAKLGLVVKGTLLFFVMGLGLGLPYLILATFSGLLDKMPQSGMWMVWVRKFFAILLIGVALYFLLPQLERIHNKFGFLAGLLGIFGGLLLGFLDHAPGYTRSFKWIRAVIGIVLIVLGITWTNSAIHSRPSDINWIHPGNETIESYINNEKPVFIDFYADWCAPCKQLDNKTFSDADVVEKAKLFTMIKIDCTVPDKATQEIMSKYNVSGMPTLIFISKTGRVLTNLTEIGFVDAKQFISSMDEALSAE